MNFRTMGMSWWPAQRPVVVSTRVVYFTPACSASSFTVMPVCAVKTRTSMPKSVFGLVRLGALMLVSSFSPYFFGL